MDIRINDNWKIKSDELNIILQKRVKKKIHAENKWRNIGYYGQMEDVLDRLLDQMIIDSGATSFEKLHDDIAEIRDELRAFSTKQERLCKRLLSRKAHGL